MLCADYGHMGHPIDQCPRQMAKASQTLSADPSSFAEAPNFNDVHQAFTEHIPNVGPWIHV